MTESGKLRLAFVNVFDGSLLLLCSLTREKKKLVAAKLLGVM